MSLGLYRAWLESFALTLATSPRPAVCAWFDSIRGGPLCPYLHLAEARIRAILPPEDH
jgi:hypothetical protein